MSDASGSGHLPALPEYMVWHPSKSKPMRVMVRLPLPDGTLLTQGFPIRAYASINGAIDAAKQFLDIKGRIYWHEWPAGPKRRRVYVETRTETDRNGNRRERLRAVACIQKDGQWRKRTFWAGGKRSLNDAIKEAENVTQ